MNGTSNVLDHCEAHHLTHFLTYVGATQSGGVTVSGTGHTVSNCTIHDTAANGISASGTGHTIVTPGGIHFWKFYGDVGAREVVEDFDGASSTSPTEIPVCERMGMRLISLPSSPRCGSRRASRPVPGSHL